MSNCITGCITDSSGPRCCRVSARICQLPKVGFFYVICAIALVVIGILASTGVLSSLGPTGTHYLSIGMYSGAAFFLGAAILLRCCKRVADKHERVRLLEEARSLNSQIYN